MPTLLSINNYFYRRGGAEVVFIEHNNLFEQNGWRVIPFAMRHEKNPPSEWEQYFVNEIEFGQKYSLLQKMNNAIKITYSIEARDKIGSLIKEVKPNVAHAHNIYHHISPSFFSLLKEKGIATVLTLHDLKLACPAYKMLTHDGICERCKGGKLWNVALHKCIKDSYALSSVVMFESVFQKLIGSYKNNVDRFVVPSKFYLEKMVEWGWPREKFQYIPNFVDVDALIPGLEVGKSFVYFGRLGPEKGLVTFIKAVAKAGQSAVIIGTGPIENELKELVNSLSADIQFLGYQTGEPLFDVIRKSRAVVLPSEWYENAPISLLESYALQKPVIGANIGGIPELIKQNETGALFDSGDIEGLAQLLLHFSEMPDEEVSRLGKNARDWVLSDFTVEKYLENTTNLYRKLGVDC